MKGLLFLESFPSIDSRIVSVLYSLLSSFTYVWCLSCLAAEMVQASSTQRYASSVPFICTHSTLNLSDPSLQMPSKKWVLGSWRCSYTQWHIWWNLKSRTYKGVRELLLHYPIKFKSEVRCDLFVHWSTWKLGSNLIRNTGFCLQSTTILADSDGCILVIEFRTQEMASL